MELNLEPKARSFCEIAGDEPYQNTLCFFWQKNMLNHCLTFIMVQKSSSDKVITENQNVILQTSAIIFSKEANKKWVIYSTYYFIVLKYSAIIP